MTTPSKFYNLARMYSASTGDSDIVLTTAVPGCLTFALAGVSDSEEVDYGLITYDVNTHRPTGSECGLGKYISSGSSFQRTAIESSTDSDNSAIDLTGLTEIYLTPTKRMANVGYNPFAQYTSPVSEVTISDSATGTIPIDSATFDDFSLGTFNDSDDTVTINNAGWYHIVARIGYYSNAGAFDGSAFSTINVTGTSNPRGETRGYPSTGTILDDELTIDIPALHIANTTSYVWMQVNNYTSQEINAYLVELVITLLKKD